MIFYTLKGPSHKLDILNEKVVLTRRSWLQLFTREPHSQTFDTDKLHTFEITSSRLFFWGQVEWSTSDGAKGSFRFSTSQEMMQKIEKYMQRRIEKNHQVRSIQKEQRDEDQLISQPFEIAA